MIQTACKSLILNGEMSEWSIEHPWKAWSLAASKPSYAALWKSSIWRIQLVSGFHLGKIWATKFPNPRKRMQARRLSGSIA